ncbi:hypothetical protein ROZALSC1DRAFT_23840 [Rozella allomycis CSF55]|uniref:Uncharacterized protein n=1 Tax=Rozella allomycis (strain CSF55) TaxID=988480 RepID=A0A4P9YEK6_ROZAC|nr:hypothetical protein ROZALSC1DRAFT_23840 [Rozella allomycis CSF55]
MNVFSTLCVISVLLILLFFYVMFKNKMRDPIPIHLNLAALISLIIIMVGWYFPTERRFFNIHKPSHEQILSASSSYCLFQGYSLNTLFILMHGLAKEYMIYLVRLQFSGVSNVYRHWFKLPLGVVSRTYALSLLSLLGPCFIIFLSDSQKFPLISPVGTNILGEYSYCFITHHTYIVVTTTAFFIVHLIPGIFAGMILIVTLVKRRLNSLKHAREDQRYEDDDQTLRTTITTGMIFRIFNVWFLYTVFSFLSILPSFRWTYNVFLRPSKGLTRSSSTNQHFLSLAIIYMPSVYGIALFVMFIMFNSYAIEWYNINYRRFVTLCRRLFVKSDKEV